MYWISAIFDHRDPDAAETPVVGLTERYAPGTTAHHKHVRSQLIFASEASLTMLAAEGFWILPPGRALFIPSGLEHALKLARPAAFTALYFDPYTEWLAKMHAPRVIAAKPLLRELILAMAVLPWHYTRDSSSERLARVLCDNLICEDQLPLHLSKPKDARACRLVDMFVAQPAERRPLADLASDAGASLRTLERLFKTETGLSLGQWVQQFRLMSALERLAEGGSVSDVAFEVGFDSASSFIALFRSRFGTTPGKYFS